MTHCVTVWAFCFLLGVTNAAVAGWTTYPFPHPTTYVPSVALFGSTGAAAVYQTQTGYAYSLSTDRGKTWGASVPLPDVPLTASPTLESSGEEVFLFFTTDTISAFRLRSDGLSTLPAPLSTTDLQSLLSTRTREGTRLFGAAGCGTGCIALAFGVVGSHGADFGYNLEFRISTTHGDSWESHTVESWHKTQTSLSQIELTAGDLAFHHDTFMIGMSSRSSVDDTTHRNTWRASKDHGKTWNAFDGWNEYRHYQRPLVDLQIIGRRHNKWSAVGFLEGDHSPLYMTGGDGDAAWEASSPLSSPGYVHLVEFHQGVLALVPLSASIAQQISLHPSTGEFGAPKSITGVDQTFNVYHSGWSRHASFNLPNGLVSIKATGGIQMLVFEDCGPNTVDITGDVPYTCCAASGCNQPQPSPTPPRPPTQPPSRPPIPPAPSIIDTLSNIDVLKLTYGILAGFLGLSVAMAVVSIVMRRVRGTTYTDVSTINRGGESSDDVALNIKA